MVPDIQIHFFDLDFLYQDLQKQNHFNSLLQYRLCLLSKPILFLSYCSTIGLFQQILRFVLVWFYCTSFYLRKQKFHNTKFPLLVFHALKVLLYCVMEKNRSFAFLRLDFSVGKNQICYFRAGFSIRFSFQSYYSVSISSYWLRIPLKAPDFANRNI